MPIRERRVLRPHSVDRTVKGIDVNGCLQQWHHLAEAQIRGDGPVTEFGQEGSLPVRVQGRAEPLAKDYVDLREEHSLPHRPDDGRQVRRRRAPYRPDAAGVRTM